MASTSTSTGGLTATATLPTKRHDGGGDKRRDAVGETQKDAFSRYSSDLHRLKAILLFDEDEDDNRDQADDDLASLATINRALSSAGLSNLNLNQGHGRGNEDASKRRRGNHSRPLQQSNQRKTRLSWEAHPSLLLHEMMLELDVLDHDHCVSDEDDEEDQTEEHSRKGKGNDTNSRVDS